MKNKLLITLIISAIAILTFGVISASAATEGYYTYTVSNDEATITKVDTAISGDVVVPDTLGGYPVTRISGGVFYNRTDLTSITIPDSVTQIIGNVFYNCIGLTKVNITNTKAWCNIDFVGIHANPLYYAKKLYLNDNLLTDFVVPDGVTSIKKYAFYNCTSLKSITFPDSVTTIGEKAFYGCEGLINITIPDSITNIGDCAFNECTGLTSITIGDGVKNIGEFAFSDCSNLTKVSITSLEAWCNISFNDIFANPLYYAKNLYLNNALVTDLIIPESVTGIKDSSFANCSELTSISFPDGITSIGEQAFAGCKGLTSITIPVGVTRINEATFLGCSGLTNVTIPDGVTTIDEATFFYCTSLTSIIIPDSVKTIGSSAFEGCAGLTSITIDKSVTSIGIWAFYGCTSLRSVYYSGTEDNWNKISIDNSTNESLINATIYYLAPCTKTAISSDGKDFSVKTVGIENGKMIILALYDGETLIDLKASPCTGADIPFTTTKTYTKARVFVWNSLSGLSPLLSPEIIE